MCALMYACMHGIKIGREPVLVTTAALFRLVALQSGYKHVVSYLYIYIYIYIYIYHLEALIISKH
jgi:hypothetical protein